MAQFYQMQCVNNKLVGANAWFIIEIMSFYGYILAATETILMNSFRSSLGWLDKTKRLADRYRYDFVTFHRDDLDWAAFV